MDFTIVPESEEVITETVQTLLIGANIAGLTGNTTVITDEIGDKFLSGSMYILQVAAAGMSMMESFISDLSQIPTEDWTFGIMFDGDPDENGNDDYVDTTIQFLDALFQAYMSRDKDTFRALIIRTYLSGLSSVEDWMVPLFVAASYFLEGGENGGPREEGEEEEDSDS